VITALCLALGEASSGILCSFGPTSTKDMLRNWNEIGGGLLRCPLLQPFIHTRRD